MAATIEPSVAVEIDEVDEQVSTHAASKAGGVPGRVGTQPGREHSHVAAAQSFFALQQNHLHYMH